MENKFRNIFLNNMNTWLSNFIIEELRTEIYENDKNSKVILNKFNGTINLNLPRKLPRFFEFNEVEISYAHHYEDDFFKNDVYIYNLEDCDLNEIEYIIRGLKVHAKDKEEKTLILISNIMTWARTPPKSKPDEDEKEGDKSKRLSLRDNELSQEEKTFFYTDKNYEKRVPSNKYIGYKFIENLALASANTNKSLNVHIVCPGFIYGCGEDFFYDFFKMAWFQNPEFLPILEENQNYIPTVHVIDLAKTIKFLLDGRKVTDRYIFAVDKTKDKTLKGVIKAISNAVGNGEVSIIPFNSPEIENFPNINELMINVKVKTSSILEGKQGELSTKKNFEWHCEYGIAENTQKLKDEFKEYRNLKNMKIIVTGMPGTGKSTLSSLLSKELNLPHIKIASLIDYTKALNNEIGQEVDNKINEIINKQVEEAEAIQAKKKIKNPPPIDRSQFTARLPDELVTKIYKSKLRENICQNVGYVLDGFPRTIAEAKSLFFKENPNYILSEQSKNQQPLNKKQPKEQQFDKEKYNEEYGHLVIEKDISPFYIINITNLPEDIIKMRLKESFLQNEANQGQTYSEERINRRLAAYKQQQVLVHTLMNEYGIEVINLDGKLLNHPDFLLKKATEEIEKNEKFKNLTSEVRKQEEEDFICDQSEIFVEGGKEDKEDSNFK